MWNFAVCFRGICGYTPAPYMRVRPALARIIPALGLPERARPRAHLKRNDRPEKVHNMANTLQSKKRARQNARRLSVNKARRSRIRTFLRKVEEAIASGDKEAAQNALRAAQPELMRGVSKGVFHKNTASRKMARLSSRVKSLG